MIDLSQKIVYLAAPKYLLSSDQYDRAFTYLLQRCKGVINPRWMFSSNQDWLENLSNRLLESKANAMVIVSDEGIVGKGVYTEHLIFFNSHCPILHYIEDEQFIEEYDTDVETKWYQDLIPVRRLRIIDEDDWVNYAKIT